MMNLRFSILAITTILFMPSAWGERGIVPTDFTDTQEFSLASEFLEKYVYILDTKQTEDVKDILRRTKEDGFCYQQGNDAKLKALTGEEDFSISFEDGNYSAQWAKNGHIIVSCSFPANIELLTFSNKIELENNLIDSLLIHSAKNNSIKLPVRETSTLTPVSFSDFFIENKGFYITPRLKHQLVFEKDSANPDSCVLLTDIIHYQLESIANMMLSGYSETPHKVNLKVDKYGYNSQIVPTTLPALYSFLSQNGSIPYWGVETFDGYTVKGLWLWINRQGGFAHMLTVPIPTKVLPDNPPLEAKLHCYLRLDNLKSLFEEYHDL